jgi:hypothetical protein
MVVMVLVLCDITVVSLRVLYKPFDEINTINNRHINFYNILYSYLMKKEDYIKKKSMVSIRYGLQKHFLKIRDFDIVNRPEMKSANV